jgi:hypothetical protein
MKRLNLETGKPFKCGYVRQDGKIFRNYLIQTGKDGYRYEIWEDESTFYKRQTERKLNSRKYKITSKGRANHILGNCKNGAKKRKIVFNLTTQDILPAIQAGFCQLTGLPFDFKPHKEKEFNPYAPSVDRINNDKGYEPDNIRVVLWAVNAALSENSDEEALPILEALVKALKRNAKQKSTTPLSKRNDRDGQLPLQYGTLSTPWTREDSYDLDHYQRTVQGEDADYWAQTRGGDGVGYGMQEVGTPSPVTRIENHGDAEPEIVRLEFGSRHLPD